MSGWTLFLLCKPVSAEDLIELGRMMLPDDKAALLRPAADSLARVEQAAVQAENQHWLTVDCIAPEPWGLARIDHRELAALILSCGRTATWSD